MKLSFTIVFIVLLSFLSGAQNQVKDSIKGWKTDGKATLLFSQSSFSNWISGGEDAVAGNLNINYIFNYTNNNWTWNNKINIAYGINDSKSNGTRKTEDRVEWNTLIGYKKSKEWYYSFFLNFQTQFTKGYDYKKDPKGTIPISRAFAPAYFNFGPGIMYQKSDKFKFNLAPATSKLTIVADDILADQGAYGVANGKHIAQELGFFASAYHKITVLENIDMINIVNFYSNYLKNIKNVDFDYQLNFVMKVNKYMSTNLNFQAIYNDDAVKRLQFKEVFGIGVNYAL
jgi:Protein of unknown function (DUF3078)